MGEVCFSRVGHNFEQTYLWAWWNSVTSKHEHAVMLTSIEKMETLNKFKRDAECTLMSGGAPSPQGNPRALSC